MNASVAIVHDDLTLSPEIVVARQAINKYCLRLAIVLISASFTLLCLVVLLITIPFIDVQTTSTSGSDSYYPIQESGSDWRQTTITPTTIVTTTMISSLIDNLEIVQSDSETLSALKTPLPRRKDQT